MQGTAEEIVNEAENILYAVVLLVSPLRDCSVPATMGAQAHAAFLATVNEVDHALAKALHQPGIPRRPFTVSRLWGTEAARDGRLHLKAENTYWWRFTGLYPPIFRHFMEHFLGERERPAIRIGHASFLVREILVTPGSHPWAGYTTWAELASSPRAAREITLHFQSATAFGLGQKPWGKKSGVLPDPQLVFQSLARLWNTYAPAPLSIDREALRTYIEEAVVIKRIKTLRTHMLRFGRAPQVGFTGVITYGLMADEGPLRAQITTLADFAFYAGVGMKRSMSMGQVRRLQEADDVRRTGRHTDRQGN